MPPICTFCKQIGHSLRHCRDAPAMCSHCASTAHPLEKCPKILKGHAKPSEKRSQRRERQSPPPTPTRQARLSAKEKGKGIAGQEWIEKTQITGATVQLKDSDSKLKELKTNPAKKGILSIKEGKRTNYVRSKSPSGSNQQEPNEKESTPSSEQEIEEDSSDIASSDFEEEEFQQVLSRRQKRESRGKSLKPSH